VCELSPTDYLSINEDKLLREKFQESLLEIADNEEKDFIASKLKELSIEENDNNSEEIRNILLIGRTGSGKSTLGNVLVNKDNNFEEVFKESAASVSETKNVKTEKFTIDLSEDGKKKVDYLVIDTIGFGDTQLETKEILGLLKDLVPIIRKNGLNQIFFVTGGRFTQEEIDTYKLLKSVLFDEKASNYTTIIRTNFPGFEKSEKREADKKKLWKENQEVFKILSNSKIVYVDNPPISDHYSDVARIARESSRRRLITHLGTCQDNYYPSDLTNLGGRIDNFMEREEELKRALEEKEKIVKEQELELQKEVETIQSQKTRELKITERNFERQTQALKNQNRKKLEAIRQELDEAHSSQLQKSREAHSETVNEIRQTIQNNLSQIRNSYGYVEVGEPICSRGHDRNIQTYDKSGYLIPDYQSDFIGHVYCPTCGRNDYSPTLRNAKTYSLEE
jgi:flagellar biosynthesis GTPase FlhF